VSPAQIQAAFETQFRTPGCCLAAVIRLHQRPPDEHIASTSYRIRQEEFVVSGFVSSKEKACAIISLDENPNSAAYLRSKARNFLKRCWQVSKANTG
jgi:hypothetical protein